MNKFALILLTSPSLCLQILAQNTPNDIAKLRKRVNVPSTTVIVSAKNSDAIKNGELKVYLATDGNEKARKRFAKWIERWNQEDALRYGKLSIVSGISEADVILVRYVLRSDFTPRPRTTVTIADPQRSIPSPEKEPRIKTTIFIPEPQYNYLLIQTDDHLEIAYGNIDRSHPDDGLDPDKELFQEFEKKLKSR